MKTPLPKLKPCPFCGNDGCVYRWEPSLYWTASCATNGCVEWLNRFETKEEAIATWNRRAGV